MRKRHEHLENDADDSEPDRIPVRRSAYEECHRRAHRADIGGDIDGIRDQQQYDDGVEQPRRVAIADIGRQSVTRDAADARAHGLDADHQRERE